MRNGLASTLEMKLDASLERSRRKISRDEAHFETRDDFSGERDRDRGDLPTRTESNLRHGQIRKTSLRTINEQYHDPSVGSSVQFAYRSGSRDFLILRAPSICCLPAYKPRVCFATETHNDIAYHYRPKYKARFSSVPRDQTKSRCPVVCEAL